MQPSSPAQLCTVNNYIGVVTNSDITNINVVCTTPVMYSIGGSVIGLAGSGLILQNNNGDDLTISANGSFIFPTAMFDTTSYSVNVVQQPTNLSQTCVVNSGSGTLVGANITNVQVVCTSESYVVTAYVTGLAGAGLVLQNNSGDNKIVMADGPVNFTSQSDGSNYNISIFSNPENLSQTCAVSNGGGTITGANVNTVNVTCTTNQYLISTTVVGLNGDGLILQNNGLDDLTVISDGSYSFTSSLADGSVYEVSILAQPENLSQTCVVNNGSGTLSGADINNIQIDCSTNSYSVSVNVNGLIGSGLVLQINNADDINIAGDGIYTFSQNLLSGNGYNITVAVEPIGPVQTCTVDSSIGTVTDSDLTLIVNCSEITYTIGGTVSGLITNGGTTGVELGLNGQDTITVTINGSFTFSVTLASGSRFISSVLTQPTSPTQTCFFLNDSQTGLVAASNITSLLVECIDPNVSGNLDPDFGTDGVSLIDIEEHLLDDFGESVSVVLPDNKILVAGTSQIGASFDFALLRLNSDGTRDTTFNNGNNNGFVRTDLNAGSNDQVMAMAVDNLGRILVVGDSLNGGWDFAVVRYDENGVLDPSFGNNGIAITDLSTSADHALAIAVSTDNSFIVVGRTRGSPDFALVRYDSAGIPDIGFNGGDIANLTGTVTLDFAGRDDYANAVAITSSGKILVAGYASFRTGTGSDFALVQYNADGTLDTTFGPDQTGIVTTHISNSDIGTAMQLQSSGEIVVGGYTNNGSNNQW